LVETCHSMAHSTSQALLSWTLASYPSQAAMEPNWDGFFGPVETSVLSWTINSCLRFSVVQWEKLTSGTSHVCKPWCRVQCRLNLLPIDVNIY